MVGVFFMSESLSISGVPDQSIHLFDNEAEAQEFIFAKLVEVGEIEIDGNEFQVDGERFDSQDDAVDAARESFGLLEFFHAYGVVDHRKVHVSVPV